ncbi:MAG: succinate dehydrogenase iron-sulfur subunit [Acidobacteria bacterium]|nr:succinate dehydrogenase iron-sulfur subunit [Acidobacteriota bacterium]
MRVKLRVKRFEAGRDTTPYWSEFQVEVEPTDRVLDALHSAKWYQDGTLAFRRSCEHGICGSDAMLINGKNRLACKTLVRDLGEEITVEPLRGFAVVKDLVVDMDGFFAKLRAIQPYLMAPEPAPKTERRQSPSERQRYDDTTKCILCAACTTACPSFWSNPDYVGPAAIVNAHRFVFDSRDEATAERLSLLSAREGVWRCRTIFNCVDACPRGIDVTRAIGEIKKAILLGGR